MVNDPLRAATPASHRQIGRAKERPRAKRDAPPPSDPGMPKSKPLMAKSSVTDHANEAVASALRTLDAGVSGVSTIAAALGGPLGPAFTDAVDLIRQAKGRVI